MKPIPFIIVFKCLCERNEIKRDYYLHKKFYRSILLLNAQTQEKFWTDFIEISFSLRT